MDGTRTAPVLNAWSTSTVAAAENNPTARATFYHRGVVIAVVPFLFGDLLSAIGGGSTLVGPMICAVIVLSSVGASLRPDFSTELNVS